MLPQNFGNPQMHVNHRNLVRYDADSPFKSDCPVCGIGCLAMRRTNEGVLTNLDRCNGCGQAFVYQDVVEGLYGIQYK